MAGMNAAMLDRLEKADVHNRFRAYSARTRADKPIIVHSKVTIGDDDFLRIGSANLNNRSAGLDTEVDMAIEAEPGEAGDDTRETIATFRNLLIGHYVDRNLLEVEAALRQAGSIAGAIALLDHQPPRLRPVKYRPLGPIERFVSSWSLGDPTTPGDAWRPWVRRKCLRVQAELIEEVAAGAPLPAPSPAADGPTPRAPVRRTATQQT